MNNLIKKIVGSVIAIIPVVLIISGILFGFNILSILQFFLLPGIVILTIFNLYLFFRVDGKAQNNGQQKKASKQNNASNNQTVETKNQDEQTGNKEQKRKEVEQSSDQNSNKKEQNNEKQEVKDFTVEQNENEEDQNKEKQTKEEESQNEKTSTTKEMIKVIKPKKLESYFQSSKGNQDNKEEQLEEQSSTKNEANSATDSNEEKQFEKKNKDDAELLKKAKDLGPKGWSAITMGATSLISLIVKIIKEKRKNEN